MKYYIEFQFAPMGADQPFSARMEYDSIPTSDQIKEWMEEICRKFVPSIENHYRKKEEAVAQLLTE